MLCFRIDPYCPYAYVARVNQALGEAGVPLETSGKLWQPLICCFMIQDLTKWWTFWELWGGGGNRWSSR